ncbi:MAG: chemotaxis protein CheW [Candidatus Acidiferrales bacterium]
MKFASHDIAKPKRAHPAEAIILFSAGRQTFAIAADSVQEIRSTDSLAGAAFEIQQSDLPKVRHTIQRNRRTYYVVNACAHFGLPVTRPTLVLILRQMRVAVLVDRIERMVEISAIHALPRAFSGDERRWYRGLAYVDDHVIPVLQPSGFLTPEEFECLDRISRVSGWRDELQGTVRA